jgi:hypothetical protein
MTLFQWFFFPLFVLSAVVALSLALRGRIRRRTGFLWSLLWFLAAAAVARPDWTTRVSNVFGIGRGVDFVIYLNLIAGLYVTVSLYSRSRRLETIVTELVRQKALSKPERRGAPGTESYGPEPGPGKTVP